MMTRYTYRRIWGSLLGVGLLLMLAACSDDPETEQLQGGQVRLLSVTRDGSEPADVVENDIKLFIMTVNQMYNSGTFSYRDSKWLNNGLAVKENTQYYMYGYMPAKLGDSEISCNISATDQDNPDYSKGADLKFTDLPVFTDQDICVTVGVRRVTGDTDENWNKSADVGEYNYLSGISSENYLNLFMDHLYAGLELSFKVDAAYAELRNIHLKEVKLTSTYSPAINATVSLRKGLGLTGHVVFNSPAEGTAQFNTLYQYDTAKEEKSYLNTTLPQTLNPVYCAPCIFGRKEGSTDTYLSITSKYDVYDRKGNPIRMGCTATNRLDLQGMNPGVYRKLTLIVKPTYLYMLSEPDLDNPTLEVKSGE